ncbi:hypothetical protein, partial [Escherichia coli]|uniref:hypothetical protein n=1 Tax=Escherichia coli TaxID=562 RepID=UPI001A9306D8
NDYSFGRIPCNQNVSHIVSLGRNQNFVVNGVSVDSDVAAVINPDFAPECVPGNYCITGIVFNLTGAISISLIVITLNNQISVPVDKIV